MKRPIDREPWLIAIALVVATIAVYAPVRHFDFVNYDDNDYVYANPMVTPGFSIRGAARTFASFHAANWHPVTWLSHMTDVQLFGLDAGDHHAVNLLLHLINSVLLYHVLRRLTAAGWPSAVVASLFALHPLNVETVAWVAERKSLLSTMAWLLSIEAYRRWTVRRSVRRYLLVAAVFAVGLMSKPMIVTLPATLIILDIWPLKRITRDELSNGTWRPRAASLIIEKLPLFALSAVSSAITIVGQASARATTSHAEYPLDERIISAANGLLWYIEKAFVPTNLCVLYPHPLASGVPASRPLALLSVILFGALFAIAARSFRNRPWIMAGLGWYVVTLLPVIGIIQVGSQSYADRYAYVPLLGIFVAVVWTVHALIPPSSLGRPAAALMPCAVLTLFGIAARGQVETWRNSETLFTQAIEVHAGRNAIAQKNLAAHYSELGSRAKAAGEPVRALELFHAASALHAEPGVLYNEAAALSDLHRYREAIPLYIRSLELDPENSDGWLNLGDAQVVTGNYPAAVHSYRRVLSLRPDKYADYGLAYACARTGDAACSNTSLQRLASVDPQLASDALAMIAR